MESVENKCRVCLKIDRPSKLLPLDANNSEHAERIFLIAGIKVSKDEKFTSKCKHWMISLKIDDCYTKYLPNKICCNCADALIRAIEIQTLCLESYKLLMEELNDHHLSKSEKIKFEADEKLEIEEEYCEEVHLEEESDPHEFDDPTELDGSKTLECDVQVDKSATESNKLMNVAAHEICEHCGKSYSRKYIKTHLRTHREKEQKMKRFICDLCGLSFSLKCYTYSHMINIHLTSKKWICKAVSKDGTTCGRSYAKVRVGSCDDLPCWLLSIAETHIFGSPAGPLDWRFAFVDFMSEESYKLLSNRSNVQVHVRELPQDLHSAAQAERAHENSYR